MKREEERLQKELKEREDEEARKILEDARKKGRAKGLKDVTGRVSWPFVKTLIYLKL